MILKTLIPGILYCLSLKSKTLHNCISSSFLHHFSGITGNLKSEFGAKIYFTDHWTANTIRLYVDVKGIFLWSFFFLIVLDR